MREPNSRNNLRYSKSAHATMATTCKFNIVECWHFRSHLVRTKTVDIYSAQARVARIIDRMFDNLNGQTLVYVSPKDVLDSECSVLT